MAMREMEIFSRNNKLILSCGRNSSKMAMGHVLRRLVRLNCPSPDKSAWCWLFLAHRIWGDLKKKNYESNLTCAFFFFKVKISSRTPIPLFKAMISPQWFNELKWPRTSVLWRVACELISLMGSLTTPGQHWQPSPTSVGKERMRLSI